MRRSCFAELSAFVAVAEQGSFTKAAAQLGVSKGSLSHSIREIEERLGVRLLNRTTRSVAPTEAGERMLARLRPLFDDLEATVDEVNEFRDRPAGHLRLTMPRPVASFVIAPLLARFVAQYPEITVDISVSPALTDIVAGRYDAGFRVGNRIGRDMIAVRVTDALRFVVAASPEYLARHPAPEKPQDLHAHNCICLRFPSGEFLPWRFVIDGKIQELEVEGSLIASDSDLLARAAVDGAGVVYTLAEYAAPMIASGQLVPLLQTWMAPPSEGFFLYYPSRRQNLASLRAFIEFLRTNRKANARAADAHELVAADAKKAGAPHTPLIPAQVGIQS
jgi:DNA-binding transcriptional LysR family regulator